MAAALATLPLLADGTAQRALQERTERLRRFFEQAARDRGLPGRLAGGAGHFQWYFNAEPVVDYRTAMSSDVRLCAAFASELLERRILVGPNLLSHQALSMAHDESVLQEVEQAMRESLDAIAGH